MRVWRFGHGRGAFLLLCTYRIIDEAAQAYDIAAWRFGHGRGALEFLAPPLLIQTQEEQRPHKRAQVQLSITEADKHQMEEWRCLYPADVNYELSSGCTWRRRRGRRRGGGGRGSSRHSSMLLVAARC
jgi:hypothetical protein